MHLLKKRGSKLLLVTLLLDVLFFTSTDPAKVSPLWLIVGFVLAVASLHGLFRILLWATSVYFKAVRKQQRQLAAGFTVLAALLLGMQSMGQLSVKDLLVLTPLCLLGYFYVRYNRRTASSN